ncbi:MAG: GIY-YIG nuclease family protein [Spirulina sp. SIO3F2]|nr:GIY-YIG nuclease family protein [Spirulina sp. SIO3F2]
MINPENLNLATLPSVPLEKRTQLPSISGIYFALDADGVVHYIGRSVDIQQRWTQHHRLNQLSAMHSPRIAYLQVSDTSLLPAIEEALIEWFKPSLNGALVAKTTSKYPIVFYTNSQTKELLDRLSKKRNRSISNLMETLAIQEVEAAQESGEIEKSKQSGEMEG